MRLDIRHRTLYSYGAPVFIEPHIVRLTPHTNHRQRAESFEMRVEPDTANRSTNVDLEGNETVLYWFEEKTDRFAVDTRAVVETFVTNPFEFFIAAPECQRLPAAYPDDIAKALQPYLVRPAVSAAVDDWAAGIANEAGADTVAFLSRLCAVPSASFDQLVRLSGEPWTPAKTLAEQQGACRDLTALFMDACRAQGLAARFVSGYMAGEPKQLRYLHAWAEVYLPGAGWRGFDPSSGIAVSDQHVTVAYAAESHLAAPIAGGFRGTDVGAEMDVQIQIEAV